MSAQTDLIAELVRPHADLPVPRALAPLVRGGWKEYGTCGQTDAELWFADTSRRIHDRAASICKECPVRRSCLTWALVFGEEYGIWGGLNTPERRPLEARLTRGQPVAAVVDEALTSAPARAFAPGGEAA